MKVQGLEYITTNIASQDLENVSRATCRSLCEKIFGVLPREVRDMIYESVLDEEDRVAYASEVCEPVFSQARAHYWHVEFVGRSTLRELLETWYRLARIQICLGCGILESFLSSKVLYMDMPRHRLLKNISINFNLRDILHGRLTRGIVDNRRSLHCARVLDQLERLFLLKRGASIHFYAVDVPKLRRKASSLDRPVRLLLPLTASVISGIAARLKAAGYQLAMGALFSPARSPTDESLYHLGYYCLEATGEEYWFNGVDSDLVWS